MKQALIGGGNSQRSAYQAHCGDKGRNRAQRVEVSTLTRKADEAQKATGADPSRCAKGLPSQVLGIKVCSPSARGAGSKTSLLGDRDAEKVGNFEVANQLRNLGADL